jgi:hypothetical protein
MLVESLGGSAPLIEMKRQPVVSWFGFVANVAHGICNGMQSNLRLPSGGGARAFECRLFHFLLLLLGHGRILRASNIFVALVVF